MGFPVFDIALTKSYWIPGKLIYALALASPLILLLYPTKRRTFSEALAAATASSIKDVSVLWAVLYPWA